MKFKMFLCRHFGHRLPEFKHPQQEGVECKRCTFIVNRDGDVIAPPLAVTHYFAVKKEQEDAAATLKAERESYIALDAQ